MERKKLSKLAAAFSLTIALNAGSPFAPREAQPRIVEAATTQEDFKSYIQEIRNRYHQVLVPIIDKHPYVLGGFKNFTNDQLKQDLEIYLPIYVTAANHVGHPDWYLVLWLVHEHESGDSRMEGWYYRGGFQRSYWFFSDEAVERAAAGFEDLAQLPGQRFRKNHGSQTDDYKEAVWAADKLAADYESAKEAMPYGNSDQWLLRALESYSSTWAAESRFWEFVKLRTFMPVDLFADLPNVFAREGVSRYVAE
ncbi:hypothetical protein M1116_02615 [Patescibacteria group bacterium]|nr:hypothetical protein [Patescibacteria group bacterium]